MLIPRGEPRYEYIDNKGNISELTLTTSDSDKMLNDAIDSAREAGLPWMESDITLVANNAIKKLISENLKKVQVDSDLISEETENSE